MPPALAPGSLVPFTEALSPGTVSGAKAILRSRHAVSFRPQLCPVSEAGAQPPSTTLHDPITTDPTQMAMNNSPPNATGLEITVPKHVDGLVSI
jgi:hypothetical protein